MVANSLCWNDDIILKKSQGIHKVNGKHFDALIEKLERKDMKTVNLTVRCETWRGRHVRMDCSMLNLFPNELNIEQINLINYNQKGQRNPYSNTYNLG